MVLRRFNLQAASVRATMTAVAATGVAASPSFGPSSGFMISRRFQSGKKDLYATLGVTRGASEKEIKTAYLKQAKKLHPDVNPSPKAADEFAEVKKAYEVLGDSQKKAMYDQTGQADGMGGFPGQGMGGMGGNPFAGQGMGGMGGFPGQGMGQSPFPNMGGGDKQNMSYTDFEKMFEQMQGGNKQDKGKKPQGPEPGADIHFKLKLSFLEAVNGASKEISYNTVRRCVGCAGTGYKEATEKAKCQACNGRGKKVMATGFFHMQQDCNQCGGTGELGRSTCTQCTGKGTVKDRAVQTLPVPKGVDNRERLKITGKGEAGVRNGPPGNLYVEISVDEHPIFHRDGVDIHMVAPITLTQAVMGGPIRLPTLNGEIETKVPAGTQQGDKIVLRSRGVHRPTQQKQGDFYVHFAILLPKELTEKQKEAIAMFSKDEKSPTLTDPQLQELKLRYKSWFSA